MYRIDFWTLWEKARVGWFKRTTLKHVYYLGWNRSPAQVGCMRQVLGPGALGRPRGIGRRGRCEGGSGWGIPVKPWLILVNVWQKRLQYCNVISLQLKKKKNTGVGGYFLLQGIISTQESNSRLLFGRTILYHWVTQEDLKTEHVFLNHNYSSPLQH